MTADSAADLRCHCRQCQRAEPRRISARARAAARVRRQRENSKRRRARKAAVPHEPYDDLDIAERDYWLCALCGEPIDGILPRTDPKGLSIDHDTPISQGGPDTPANVHAVHLRCNLRRATRDIFAWLGFAA